MARYRYVLASAVLLCLLFFAYCNTFYSPPELDDFHSFIDTPCTHVQAWSFDTILSMKDTIFGWSRFLPVMTFSWDIWFGKGDLFYLHFTNLLIHAFCLLSIIFLVYVIVRASCLRQSTRERFPNPVALGIWIGALWALNPVQTSAVTYLVQRMACLAGLFFILSVASYVAGRLRQVESGRLEAGSLAFYLIGFLSMVLGFLSKENSAMIPVMILCTEFWFFQDLPVGKILGWSKKHWFIVLITIGAGCVFALYLVPQYLVGYQTRSFTLGQRLLTEARVVIWYVSLLVYPDPARLSLEHAFELSTSLFHPLTTFVSIATLVAGAVLCLSQRKRFPLISYGILWYVLNLVIESTILPLELVFEHRLYLSSVGMLLSITVAGYTLLRSWCAQVAEKDFDILGWCVVALVTSVLALATFQRNMVWQDVVTFNRDNVLKAPQSPRSHVNLAVAHLRSKQYEEAIREARTAISLGQKHHEDYCVASNVIISSYYSMGDYESAASEGEKLLKGFSGDMNAQALPAMNLSMAITYEAQGNLPAAFGTVHDALMYNLYLPKGFHGYEELAVWELTRLLTASSAQHSDLDGDGNPDPGDLSTGAWMGRFLYKLGYKDTAKEFLEKAVAENANDGEANRILQAMAGEKRLNQLQEDKKDFTRNYVYRPFSRFNASMALAFLARKYHLPGPLRGIGESCLDYGLQLEPDSADAHLLKAWYLYESNESEKAVASAKRALALDPENSRVWLGLGFFLTKIDPDEAISAFKRTLELYPGYPERKTIQSLITGLEKKDLDVGSESIGSANRTAGFRSSPS